MTSQHHPSRHHGIQLNGRIVNLTATKLIMMSLDHHKMFYSQADSTRVVRPMLPDLQPAPPAEQDGPNDRHLNYIYPPETIGISRPDLTQIGVINGNFPIMKPTHPIHDTITEILYQDGFDDACANFLRLSHNPDALAASRQCGTEQYYIISWSAACIAILCRRFPNAELNHWLIPAQPLPSEKPDDIHIYQSFMPASFLLATDASFTTASSTTDSHIRYA